MFVPADKVARDKGTAEPRCTTACVMCGQPSEPICWECLASTIEVVVERMACEGKLDDVMQRVIERASG